jgi:hypothetical protein
MRQAATGATAKWLKWRLQGIYVMECRNRRAER